MRTHLPSSYGFSHGRGVSLYDSTKYLSPQPILEGLMPHPANPVYSHTVRKFEDDDNQISPSVVVIIIILAIIFFLSGFLHLLIRFLARTPRRGDSNYNSENDVTALQGQLQQLFHLHDSGVEQAFIDTLPAFMYKAVKGLKETTDCAVCLCEFEADDRLRLLPKCSHAFHSDCIDTWLLSHSTCPLCRASLLPDCTDCFSSSVVVVVPSDQSGDHGSRETADGEEFREEEEPRTQNLIPSSPCSQNEENVDDSLHNLSQRTGIAIPNSSSSTGEKDDGVGKMVTIKLGKLRNIDGRGETSAGGSSSIDPRRSYSMGSYEYVLDPSNLQVFIAPIPYRKQSSTKDLPLTPGHRPNLSERMIPEQVERSIQRTPYEDIVCKSKIIKAIHSLRPKRDDVTNSYLDSDLENHGQESDMKSKGLGSQTWIRSKRVQAGSMETLDSSRRALSFRLSVGGDTKLKQSASRRTLSETEIYGWVEDDEGPNPSRESSFNDISASNENCSSASTECRESVVPSFAKRTLNWLVGRQKRVAHASASPLQHRPRPDLSRSRDQSLL